MCIRITTPEIITHRSDIDNTELIEHSVAEYLQTLVQRFNIYRVGPKNFVLIIFDRKDQNVSDIANSIVSRFEKPWLFADSIALLSVAIQIIEIPERINSVKDALYMFDSIPDPHSDKKIYIGSDLDYLFRRFSVEKSIRRGLSSHQLEVYYQPTYCIDGKTLHGAEA